MTLKIMIVDDDKEFVKKAKEFSFDANILTFTDPGEALEAIKSTNPDIIVTDVMMPGIHGFRFLKIAKDLIHSPNIVVISANPKEQVEKEFGSLETTHFFRKPLSRDFFNHIDSQIDTLKNVASPTKQQSFADVPINQLNRLAALFMKQQDFLFHLALTDKDITSGDYRQQREVFEDNIALLLSFLVGEDSIKRSDILSNLATAYQTWQKKVMNNVDKFIVPRSVKCQKPFSIGIRIPAGEYPFTGIVESYEVLLRKDQSPLLKINAVEQVLSPEAAVEPYDSVAGVLVLTSRYLDYLDRRLAETLEK